MHRRPVLLVGFGRLGSAIAEGWLGSGVLQPSDLMIRTRSGGEALTALAARGVDTAPSDGAVGGAGSVVLSVKPAQWREAAASLGGLGDTAALISVMAGVRGADLAQVFGQRPSARVMPTTSVATARGAAGLWARDPDGRAAAEALFEPLCDLVLLEDEAMMDIATAVCGSAPAFLHAFVKALAAAGVSQGLAPDAAIALARGALQAAAAAAEDRDVSLDALIARIASPGGTTQAGLDAMADEDAVARVAASAVEAAVARAREMAASKP